MPKLHMSRRHNQRSSLIRAASRLSLLMLFALVSGFQDRFICEGRAGLPATSQSSTDAASLIQQLNDDNWRQIATRLDSTIYDVQRVRDIRSDALTHFAAEMTIGDQAQDWRTRSRAREQAVAILSNVENDLSRLIKASPSAAERSESKLATVELEVWCGQFQQAVDQGTREITASKDLNKIGFLYYLINQAYIGLGDETMSEKYLQEFERHHISMALQYFSQGNPLGDLRSMIQFRGFMQHCDDMICEDASSKATFLPMMRRYFISLQHIVPQSTPLGTSLMNKFSAPVTTNASTHPLAGSSSAVEFDPYHISGAAFLQDTRRPLVDAQIRVEGPEGILSSTATDKSGHFEMTIAGNHPLHLALQVGGFTLASSDLPPRPATTANVILIAHGVLVTGSVLDLGHQPIAAATVHFIGKNGEMCSAKSDSLGNYLIGPVPVGRYTVVTEASNHPPLIEPEVDCENPPDAKHLITMH
jgi:hypothetical protein